MMTREEAKEIFLNRGYIKVDGGTIYDANKWREACSVISKLLEQEPCEDAISKQAVLDLIKVKNNSFENLFTCHQAGVDFAREVEALRPVQPKIAYPSYCGEDCRCDEVNDGEGCQYLNQEEECIIALLLAESEE